MRGRTAVANIVVLKPEESVDDDSAARAVRVENLLSISDPEKCRESIGIGILVAIPEETRKEINVLVIQPAVVTE